MIARTLNYLRINKTIKYLIFIFIFRQIFLKA